MDPSSSSTASSFTGPTRSGSTRKSFSATASLPAGRPIDGRQIFLFSQDFTVLGGSLGEAFAEKICKVMDLAVRTGSPMIGINDSGGARIQEGVVSLGGYAEIFWRNVQASGVVPQISLIAGPCAGGAVYSPAITDFIIMTEKISQMFITGPEIIKTVTGEEVRFEELGGAMTHATRSGVAHLVAADEDNLFDLARDSSRSFRRTTASRRRNYDCDDDPHRLVPALDALVPDSPNKPYDMRGGHRGRGRLRRLLRDPSPSTPRTSSAGSDGSTAAPSASSETSPTFSPASSTRARRSKPRVSCAFATPSTFRW